MHLECICIPFAFQKDVIMHRFLVVMKDGSAFYSDVFDCEESWTRQIRCVIDLASDRITNDGESWDDIEKDHL